MTKTRNILAGIGLSGSLAAAAFGSAPALNLHNSTAHLVRSATATAGAASNRLMRTNLSSGALQSAGQQMALLTTASTTRNTMSSSNWSGLAGTGSHIEGADANWTVPAVKQSAAPKYSSTWVGVDGLENRDLIQTGTSQDTASAGAHSYFAWIEILPDNASAIGNPKTGKYAAVKPGDKIVAGVWEVRPRVWTISITDKTQHWSFDHNYNYTGPGTSAEWIEEAPTIGGTQSDIANFGHAKISGTGVYVNIGQGLKWYSTGMGKANEIDLVQGSSLKAAPSAPLPAGGSSTGQYFTDTYK